MYKYFLKPIFFLFDAEKIHHFVFSFIKLLHYIPGVSPLNRQIFCVRNSKLKRELFGLTFNNPVGLAAGFDKNARLYNQLGNFGFGFIEIGTVTPKAQTGNPKKRLFRLPIDEGLINRMGFNNDGVSAVVTRLVKNKKRVLIGGNIGKNTATDEMDAEKDYILNFKALYPYVDYFVINVSCPNVGSTARLNDKDFLISLLLQLQGIVSEMKVTRPILLKIGPDRSDKELDEVIEIIKTTKIAGVIATNTATDRSGLATSADRLKEIGNGGLSGKPLTKRSTEVIKYLSEKSNKAFPIVGVGGIHTPEDAMEKIEAGASLVQIYTGFIYSGPKLVKEINKRILKESD